MGCYSCGGNPNTFCRECNYPKDTWIAPVDKLPDTFMGDFDHLFRTPDGNLYALAPERDRWIQVNGSGGNATVYKAGNGIEISAGNVITNTQPNVNQSLSINGRTISITNGNSITLPEDRDTVYNDTELKRRIQAVESKTDNFVSGVNVSRKGNKVKLTYTFVNSAPKEVEFEDKDTITLAYDDTALKSRVAALEGRQDRDNQSLSFNTSTRALTISNGNSVTIPSDKQTISKSGNKVILSNNGGEVDLPSPYDDSALKSRVTALEGKVDKDSQTLSFNNGTRELSISNGNHVTIPSDKQSISKQGNKLILSNGGGEVDLPQPTNGVSYDDTALRNRIGALEAKKDNDNQTLILNDRTLSISGGNSITLPADKDTVYNDADIKRRLTALEGKTDNFVTGVTASRTGNKVKLTYNFVTGQSKTVEFDDKDTIGVAYDDTALRNRIKALEDKPSEVVHRFYKGDIQGLGNTNETPTVSKNNFSNPDGIKVGDTVEDFYTNADLVNRGIWKVISVTGNNVKLQGIGHYDINLGKNLSFNSSTRVLSIIGGNNVTLPNDKQTISKNGNKIVLSNGGGEVDIPTATPYNDTDVKRRLTILEGKPDNDKQTLTFDNTTRSLSISNGNNVALPNDKQTISISGNTLSLSNGGGSVTLPQSNVSGYVTLEEYNKLKGALENILINLRTSGAWRQTGSTIFEGNFYQGRNIATGNINVFGGQPDGGSFIRTNSGLTENDLAGGV